METIQISVWGAMGAGFTVLSSVIGVVVWVFTTFATKAEQEKSDKKVEEVERLVREIANDVAYIRGRITSDA